GALRGGGGRGEEGASREDEADPEAGLHYSLDARPAPRFKQAGERGPLDVYRRACSRASSRTWEPWAPSRGCPKVRVCRSRPGWTGSVTGIASPSMGLA